MFILLLVFFLGSAFSGCPPGSEYIQQLDKCIAVLSNEKTGFYEAEFDCRERGGHLSSIHSGFENTLLFSLAFQERIDTNAYIGATLYDDRWIWSDGTNMTNWAPGEPSNKIRCAVLSMSDSKWYSSGCAPQNASYFCTLPTITDSTTTPASSGTTASPLSCLAGWTYFMDHCYLYQEFSKGGTWPQARSVCVTKGSDLVSIHSAEENRFLTSWPQVIGSWSTLIGLEKNGGTLSWSDGTPVDYNNATAEDFSQSEVYKLNPYGFDDRAGSWDATGYDVVWWTFICKRPATYTTRKVE